MNTIFEYAKVDDTKLSKHIIETPSLHKYFKEEWGEVKARHYCGVLSFEDQDYYVLPKISDEESNLDIFIYMLSYVYEIKIENEDFASCKNEKHHILEVFIQLFAQNLFKELKRGVYKEYVTQSDNLTRLRGKYLINENLKYNHVKNKIYCEFDEFTMNNELNQFFLFSLKTLLKYTKNKKLLKQCALVFDEVQERSFSLSALQLHFNRINGRFKSSFEFALLLLKHSVPTFSKDKKSFAFLFDMNVLFEKFIGKLYCEIEPSAQLQNQKNFGALQLKPDIMTNEMIIDTKYKRVSQRAELSAADKYQMFVYGRNFKKSQSMLLYPKHLEEVREDLELGEGSEMIELKMRSIDLDSDESYEGYIKMIKSRIKEI